MYFKIIDHENFNFIPVVREAYVKFFSTYYSVFMFIAMISVIYTFILRKSLFYFDFKSSADNIS